MAEVYYQNIEPSKVDPAKLAAAERALERGRLNLGLPPIRIHWVREISKAAFDMLATAERLGALVSDFRADAASRPRPALSSCVSRDDSGFRAKVHPLGMDLGNGKGGREPEVFVVADQPADEVAFSVYHELKHLADFRAGLFDFIRPEGQGPVERSANRYAEAMMKSAAVEDRK